VPVIFIAPVAGRLITILPVVAVTSISFGVPVILLTNVGLLRRLSQSIFAASSPIVPLNTSEVFVASGIKVNFPDESSKPKKPSLAAGVASELSYQRNSIPRSLLSSTVGAVFPPSVIIGSLIVVTVESITVVVPRTVILLTVKFSSVVIEVFYSCNKFNDELTKVPSLSK